MTEVKKAERRQFIKYVGAAIIAAAAVGGGAVAYYTTLPPKEKIVEKVVEKPVEKVVKETVKETVTVAGSPTVVEKVVEKTVEKPVEVKKFERAKEITVSTHISPWLQAFKALGDTYEKMTGTKVKFLAYRNTPELQEKLFADATAGGGIHDVMLTQYYSAPFLLKGGFLHKILDLEPGYKHDPALVDMPWQYWPLGSGKLEDLYSLPLNVNNGILYYRGDILKEKGWSPPKTYAELIELASKGNAPDKKFYGYCPEGSPVVNWFITYGTLRAFGGDYFVDWLKGDFTVRLHDESCVAAYEAWTGLALKYGPPSPGTIALSDAIAYMAKGSVLFSEAVFAAFSHFDEPAESLVPMKVESMIYPPGHTKGSRWASQEGGFAMAISKFAKNRETAWDFMKFAVSFEGQLIFALNGAATCRKDVMDNPSITENPRYRVFPTYKRGLENLVYFPQIPEMPQILGGIVGPAIGEMLTKVKTPKQALTSAAEKLAAFMKEKGYKTGLV